MTKLTPREIDAALAEAMGCKNITWMWSPKGNSHWYRLLIEQPKDERDQGLPCCDCEGHPHSQNVNTPFMVQPYFTNPTWQTSGQLIDAGVVKIEINTHGPRWFVAFSGPADAGVVWADGRSLERAVAEGYARGLGIGGPMTQCTCPAVLTEEDQRRIAEIRGLSGARPWKDEKLQAINDLLAVIDRQLAAECSCGADEAKSRWKCTGVACGGSCTACRDQNGGYCDYCEKTESHEARVREAMAVIHAYAANTVLNPIAYRADAERIVASLEVKP